MKWSNRRYIALYEDYETLKFLTKILYIHVYFDGFFWRFGRGFDSEPGEIIVWRIYIVNS